MPTSIAEALVALLDDAERRRALADGGAARAREFTWEASAEAHLAAYDSAPPRSQCGRPDSTVSP